jgi:hypothetical protein
MGERNYSTQYSNQPPMMRMAGQNFQSQITQTNQMGVHSMNMMHHPSNQQPLNNQGFPAQVNIGSMFPNPYMRNQESNYVQGQPTSQNSSGGYFPQSQRNIPQTNNTQILPIPIPINNNQSLQAPMQNNQNPAMVAPVNLPITNQNNANQQVMTANNQNIPTIAINNQSNPGINNQSNPGPTLNSQNLSPNKQNIMISPGINQGNSSTMQTSYNQNLINNNNPNTNNLNQGPQRRDPREVLQFNKNSAHLFKINNIIKKKEKLGWIKEESYPYQRP